ncbi:MAG: hypothetical protein Fur0018_04560 [Anaerolineales bacterium]
MSESELKPKPLNWEPSPDVGYVVVRRPDGGMHFTFSDLSPHTLEHWRMFALTHLLDSDRLTRNLYDLRLLGDISDEAIHYALELNNDPSTRNIRLAVVVSSEAVLEAVERIAALTPSGGVEMRIFLDLEAAEAWLSEPLTKII